VVFIFVSRGNRVSIPNQDNEFVLSSDLLLELGPPAGDGREESASIAGSSGQVAADIRTHRMKLVKELTPRVREQKLQEHGVELLWVKTKDLLETSDVVQRHDMLMFFEAMIRGQVNHFIYN